MGLAMARNIARAGLNLRVWNRSREKAEPLAKDGAVVTDTPAEAAEGATIVLTMLADADAVISGTRLKLVTNSWVLAVVEAGAETIALAEGLGLDPSMFFQAIEGGALDLPYLRMKGQAIADRDFVPSFRLTLAAKDASLVRESASQHGLDLPLLDLIARRRARRQGLQRHLPDQRSGPGRMNEVTIHVNGVSRRLLRERLGLTARGDPRADERQPVPVRRLREHSQGDR